MIKNKPVRLHKEEPLALEYDKATVYLTGALFIIVLVVLSFIIGSESFSYLLWSCI